MLSASEATSAMGKENQTASMLPLRESRYATGIRTMSWRVMETYMLYWLLPRP